MKDTVLTMVNLNKYIDKNTLIINSKNIKTISSIIICYCHHPYSMLLL